MSPCLNQEAYEMFLSKVPRIAWYRSSYGGRGFTMIELIVTMSVVAILAAVAVPSFVTIAQGQRRVAEVNDLVLSLNYARSEAVKQDSSTGVTVTANGSWAGGWRVCCTSSGATVDTLPAIDSRSSLTATLAGTAPLAVSFQSNGAQLLSSGTVLFTFCDSRGAASASAVEVNPLGHIQSGSRAGFRVDQNTALVCP
jgi:prepilin-type N-terminal cleavage/methylation domain-containing protein